MLRNSYYIVDNIQSNGNSHRFSVTLNAEHPVYAGHFPTQPVSPGVCTLQMVRECAASVLQKEFRMSSISNCKFLSLITPQHCPQLLIDMQLTPDGDGYKLDASVLNADTALFKVKARLILL